MKRKGKLNSALSPPRVNRKRDLHSLSKRGWVEVESAYAAVVVRLKLLSK
jgi:hypothetical protein